MTDAGVETEVVGIDFVALPTRDLARAMDFYENVLGLRRWSLWQQPGKPAMGAEYEAGPITLALMDCAQFGIDFQPHKLPVAQPVQIVASSLPVAGAGKQTVMNICQGGVIDAMRAGALGGDDLRIPRFLIDCIQFNGAAA